MQCSVSYQQSQCVITEVYNRMFALGIVWTDDSIKPFPKSVTAFDDNILMHV